MKVLYQTVAMEDMVRCTLGIRDDGFDRTVELPDLEGSVNGHDQKALIPPPIEHEGKTICNRPKSSKWVVQPRR